MSSVLSTVIGDVVNTARFAPIALIVFIAVFAIMKIILRLGYIESVYYSLSAAYISLVICLCFLNRVYKKRSVNLKIGSSFIHISDYHYFIDNLLLFIPAGILLFFSLHNVFRSVLAAAVISIAIELIQLIERVGETEIDDVIANSLGALAGAVFMNLLFSLFNRHGSREDANTDPYVSAYDKRDKHYECNRGNLNR